MDGILRLAGGKKKSSWDRRNLSMPRSKSDRHRRDWPGKDTVGSLALVCIAYRIEGNATNQGMRGLQPGRALLRRREIAPPAGCDFEPSFPTLAVDWQQQQRTAGSWARIPSLPGAVPGAVL
jgi:hypothetical protein